MQDESSSLSVDDLLLDTGVSRQDDGLSAGTGKGLGGLAFAVGADGGSDGHEEAWTGQQRRS